MTIKLVKDLQCGDVIFYSIFSRSSYTTVYDISYAGHDDSDEFGRAININLGYGEAILSWENFPFIVKHD